MLAFITLLFTLFYFMLITVLCNNKCLIPYFKDEETEKQRVRWFYTRLQSQYVADSGPKSSVFSFLMHMLMKTQIICIYSFICGLFSFLFLTLSIK